MVPTKSKSQKQQLKVFIAFHSNQIYQYKYDVNQTKDEKVMPEIEKVFGEMESHKLAIRGV